METFWKITMVLTAVLYPAISFTMVATEDKLVNSLSASIGGLQSNTIRISIEAEDVRIRRHFEDTVNRFLATNDGILVNLDSKESCSTFIRVAFVDSVKSFRHLVDRQRSPDCEASNVNQQYFVVLPPTSILLEHQQRTLEEIFSFCSKSYIVNVNVLIEDEHVTLYTYYPFTKSKCRGSTPTIYNRFINGSFEWNKEQFPPKLDNLYQWPIKAVYWEDIPFVWIRDGQVYGINGVILKTLATLMSFSIELVMSPEGRGLVYPNNSVTGSFKLLKDGLGDIILGGSGCVKNKRKDFASTSSLYRGYIYALVKRPEAYRSVDALLLPFDWIMWLCLSTLLIAKFICRLVWKKYANRCDAFENCSTRLHTMAWIYAMFIVRSCYEGSIFRYLQNRPNGWIPQDVDEAVDNGYKFIVHPHYSVIVREILGDNLLFYNVTSSNLGTVLEKFNGRYAVVASDLHMTLYNNDTEKYTVVPTPIAPINFCMEMQGYSFLAEAFNTKIQWLFSNGFMNRNFQNHVQMGNLLKKVKSERRSISVQHIKGAVILLATFISASAGVFVVELLAERYSCLQKLLNVFN